MKIALITRDNSAPWGGDKLVLHNLYEGLKELEEEVTIHAHIDQALSADFILLSNTPLSLKKEFQGIKKQNKRFGIIAFHEDHLKYWSACSGFSHYVALCLKDHPFFSLEALLHNPEIVLHFTTYTPPLYLEENRAVVEKADVCIAHLPAEVATLKRDYPGCHPKLVYLSSDMHAFATCESSDNFLQMTGLKKGEYVLQVSRLEARKNLLASILAMRNLDMPLVCIATRSAHSKYTQVCLRAIQKYRGAPTFIISQTLKPSHHKNMHIIRMPQARMLSPSLLKSAYENAGLYLHPAFEELPGLTLLEASQLHIPIVASSWTGILDYFTDPITNKYTLDERITYCLPYHIDEMTKSIQRQFGKKINTHFTHPFFKRTKINMAQDLLLALT